MKICGLITEYNPFHNGHIHHMKEAREITGCDYLIVVMSGNFVQRGTPAIIDKYERCRMALEGGADLVLELPVLFASATAQVFAQASINLLNQLGCVDYVCFGTENGDLSPLQKIADFLNNESESFREEIRLLARSGLNYPTARAIALDNHFGDQIDNLEEMIEKPNNILGIEYLRALKMLNSSMTPVTVKRWTTEYHEENAYYSDVASATALRNMLYEEDGFERIVPYVSPFTAREFALQYGVSTPIRANDFSEILQYRLEMERDHLTDYLDFAPELQERVDKLLPDVYDFKEWSAALNAKNFTHTRINRALLHLILNIKATDLEEYRDEDYCMYARILGFRRNSSALLSEIKDSTPLPLISKMADAKNILTPKALKLLKIDVDTSNIYRNAVYQKFGTSLKDDYTAGIVII